MTSEERALENQLELQLEEQKDSLAVLDDALSSDPSNLELLSVREELVEAIKDAEDGLSHLKRARLLREADSVLRGCNHGDEDVKVEPLDPTGVEPEPVEEERCSSAGSKRRFRHTDGRWYNGRIVGFEGSKTAKIAFLTPTAENMLVCVLCGYGGGAMTRALRCRSIMKTFLKAWGLETDRSQKSANLSAETLQDELSMLRSSGSMVESTSFPSLHPVNVEASTSAHCNTVMPNQFDTSQRSLACISNVKASKQHHDWDAGYNCEAVGSHGLWPLDS